MSSKAYIGSRKFQTILNSGHTPYHPMAMLSELPFSVPVAYML
jgi:hypothetical protein